MSYTRNNQHKAYADFFTNLDQYFCEHVINGMDVNQYVASFGNPDHLPHLSVETIARAIRRATIESHWTYYAPRPFLDIAPPIKQDANSIPPKRHFLLSLTHPGLTPASITAVLAIFAKAIATGILQPATAIDVDVPTQPLRLAEQADIDLALAKVFRAIGIGHQNALAHASHYEGMAIRFYAHTLNSHCIDLFTIAIMREKFPSSIQLRLSPSDIGLGARMLYCTDHQTEPFPYEFSVAFFEDKTAQHAISHAPLYGAYAVESAPSSPVTTAKMGIFANSGQDEARQPTPRDIELQLRELKSFYQSKVSAAELAQQLNNLKLNLGSHSSAHRKQ